MPYKVAPRNRMFRLFDANGKIARNAAGTPLDGGGHRTREAAQRQNRAIMASEARR